MAEKRKALICDILTLNADITCLLDTHLDSKTESRISDLWDGESYFAHGQDSKAGIAVLARNTQISDFSPDANGRFATFRAKISNRHLFFCAIYAPAKLPNERSALFKTLHTHLGNTLQTQEELVLLGDFNCVESPSLDRISLRKADPSALELQKLCAGLRCADAFRQLHPDTLEFTYCGPQGHASRLDRVYVSETLMLNVMSVEHPPNAFSNNTYVKASFDFSEIAQGNGALSFNRSLLEDNAFQDSIRDFWSGWKNQKHRFPSLLEWWDKGKSHIKSLSIRFRSANTKREHLYIRKLTKRLSNAINGGKAATVRCLQSQMREFLVKRASSHFYSRSIKWADLGEKCNAFFLNAHKSVHQKSLVHRIYTPKGPSSDSGEILEEFTRFYRELYTEEPTYEEDQNFILSRIQRRLDEEQSESLATPFKLQDLKSALFKSLNGKSPGNDGIPAEFYKTFWDVMGRDLFEVFQCADNLGILPKSMRQATITCLPKKGDLADVKNWRPISLLNADYKVFAKCIADRISRFLPVVISPSQTASIKRRKISHNVSLLRDFIFLADTRKLDAFLISLDQMKAYDRVNWSFLFSMLKSLNFPDTLIRWVQILYTDISSVVTINGFFGHPFKLTRGNRQGCPLSPALYDIFAEALYIVLVTNPDIIGPEEFGNDPVISQFLDDAAVGALGVDSVFAIFRSLRIFERATGAKVNPSKSHALWLGQNRGRTDKPQNLLWTSESIKVLGIHIGTDSPPVEFWTKLLYSAQTLLSHYTKLHLSFKGKVVVIKQLVMPLFLYPSFILVCPQFVISRIQSACDNFLWDGKLPKVPRHILELPVPMGGIGYPNFDRMFKAIRLSWTKDLFSSDTDGPWKMAAEFILSKYDFNPGLSVDIFKLPLNPGVIERSSLPTFYKRWLRNWSHINAASNRPRPDSAPLIRQEPLLGNHFITDSENRPLKRPAWHKNQMVGLKVGMLTYEVSPGFMPPEAVIEECDLQTSPKQVSKLQHQIPKDWREILSKPDPPDTPDFHIFDSQKRPVKVNGLTTKDFYTLLKPPSVKEAHKEQLTRKTPFYTTWETHVGPVVWKEVFLSLHKNHADRKSADLIYLLIHRGITTQTRARHFVEEIDDDGCPRCLVHRETPEHLFFECPTSVDVWEFACIFLRALDPNFKLSFVKFVIVGTGNSKNPDPPSEDVRLALVATIWKSRNARLFDGENIEHLAYFRVYLRNLLQIRALRNIRFGLEPNSKFEQIALFQSHKIRFLI